MNELVERLSTAQPIVANNPDKTGLALKERIEIQYIHILFSNTGTEIGIELDVPRCDIDHADFNKAVGSVHLEGIVTLNYDKVRCIADIDLTTMEGDGFLEPIADSEYSAIRAKAK